MTESELQAIEARANAATEGPWRISGSRTGWQVLTDADVPVLEIRPPITDQMIDDLDFAAAARTDVPALVAVVRKLRSVNSAGHSCTMLAEQLAAAQEEIRKLRGAVARAASHLEHVDAPKRAACVRAALTTENETTDHE